MIDLERMTTEYVADEDRISISARIKGDGTIRLWLTRRIADRMVPALAKVVQPRHEDPAYAEVVGEMAQQRAEQNHEPQEPVKPTHPDQEWLVCKIDLRMAKAGAVLIFAGSESEHARLTMTFELLRQWLAILRRVYQAGEWPLAVWPNALQEGAARPVAPKILH